MVFSIHEGRKTFWDGCQLPGIFFVAHPWRRSRNLLWFCVTFWTNGIWALVARRCMWLSWLKSQIGGLHKLSSFGPWWPLSAHIQAPTLVAAIQPARRHRDGLLRCRHASMRKRLWHQFKWSGRPLLTEQVQRAEVEVEEEEVVPACRSWSRTCTWLPARLPLAPHIPWPGYSQRTWRNPPGHIEHSKMPRADGKSQKPKGRLGSVIPKHAALRCACSIVSASSANNRTGILRWSWEKKNGAAAWPIKLLWFLMLNTNMGMSENGVYPQL